MFNSSTLGPSNQAANSTTNFGATPGMLQSTPTGPSSNNPVTSGIPNMFQSVKKSESTTGGLFGNKLINSPTPVNQPIPSLTSSNTLTNNTQSKPTFSMFSQNNNTNTVNNAVQQNNQFQGIGVYGVQANPVTMTLGQEMPPSLVTTKNVKKTKHKKLNLNEVIHKNIQNQQFLQANKTVSLQRKDNIVKKNKLDVKFGLGSKDLKKLDINTEKIQQIKDKLFKKENVVAENVTKEEKAKNSTKLEELFGDKVVNEVEDTNGYWCYPDINKLLKLSEEELVQIDNFTIGRKDCGNIRFCEPIDLNHLLKPSLKENLFGRIVNFNEVDKTVEVYPDEFSEVKPNIGEGLNVRAIITLFNIEYNKEKYNLNEFTNVLKSYPENEFISYDPFSKIWIFKVRHFSKYGLINEEDRYAYNGNRNVFKNKVVKPFESVDATDKRKDSELGYYEFSDDVRTVEKKVDENTYTSSAVVNDNLKKELLQNPNIIKEMVYEPMNVEAEDIQELLNDNINKNFDYSDDLLSQLQFAKGSIYNKLQLKKDLMNIELEKDLYLNKHDEESMVDEKDDSNNDDVKVKSQITTKDKELLKLLKESSTLESSEDGKTVRIDSSTLNFKDIEEYSIIFKVFAILFDEPKEVRFKKLFDFLNDHYLKKFEINYSDDPLENIYKLLAFKDIEGAIELANDHDYTDLIPLLPLLKSMSTSKEMYDSITSIAEDKVEELDGDDINLDDMTRIYRVLANDESLIQNHHIVNLFGIDTDVESMMKIMSFMNYKFTESVEETERLFKIFILRMAYVATVKDPVFRCLEVYASLDPPKEYCGIDDNRDEEEICAPMEFDKVFESFVFYNVLRYSYNEKEAFCDEILGGFKNEIDFNGVLENLFLSLFIADDYFRKKNITSILEENIETVVENKDTLINEMKLDADLIYTLIGDHYSNTDQIVMAMSSYLKTKENDDKIIDLFLNKTGPYLVFLNKFTELSQMLNAYGNHKSNESVDILSLYVDYKLSKHTDMRILRKLVEKIELFQTDREEFRIYLYKFVIEQYMLNYNTDEEILPKTLIQFIENLSVDNESVNNYFRKVIVSNINK